MPMPSAGPMPRHMEATQRHTADFYNISIGKIMYSTRKITYSTRKFDIIDPNKYLFNTYFNMAFYILDID